MSDCCIKLEKLVFLMLFCNCLVFQYHAEYVSLQVDDTFGRVFEDVEFPKSGVIPMLNRKIFKGDRVSISEHPYVVSLRRLYSHYVTGTLLTKNLVVTVAHPVYQVSITELGVVVGENYSDRGTAMLSVVIVVIHEDFDPNTLRADIALLRLYEDVMTRVAVKALSLISPYVSLDGLTGFVTGWGRCDRTGKELCLPRSSIYFQGECLDPMLRTVKFTLQTKNPHCDAYATGDGKLDPGMLCVGPARSEDPLCPCMAVPGAPLVVNARLAGLQSWGFGCGYTKDLPIVYTSIQKYIKWLVFNIPVLRKLSKDNLTDIFKATKIQAFSEWSLKTRILKPTIKKLPQSELQPIGIDPVLIELRGSVYDVRDFFEGGAYHESKVELYKAMKLALQKVEIIKEVSAVRTYDVKPFLSNDSIIGEGYVLQNGSVYFNDSDSDPEAMDKGPVVLNQTDNAYDD